LDLIKMFCLYFYWKKNTFIAAGKNKIISIKLF
jgi:hypothetical protein